MLCHTLMMMALPTKAPEVRPASVGSVDSTVRPVRCHWEKEEHSDLCDEVLEGVEAAWTAQVDGLGWPAPILDDDGLLDVYVSSEGGGGAYAYGPWEDADPSDGRMGTAAHIVIDPEFETWIYWTMLHEFNHVLQYSIDFTEPRYVPWEGTATAMEWWSDRSLWPMDEYIEDFQAQPWVGLLGDGWMLEDDYDIWSLYEYGAALWLFHLDNRTGDGNGSAGLDLWLDNAQDGWDNEPDFVDAIGTAFDSWTDGWLNFAVARISVGTDGTPAWASNYSDAKFGIRLEDSISRSDLPTSVTPEFMPLQTGAVYAELTGVEVGERVRISADGDPSVNWAVFAHQNGSGSWMEGGALEIVAERGSIIFGAVNLGSSGFDADEIIEPASVNVDVRLLSATADLDDEKAGGCSSVSDVPSPRHDWLWLCGCVLVGWRRRT